MEQGEASMNYPHKMPIDMQRATQKAAVVLGPTEGYARAPYWLAIGRTRPADDIEALHADADALQEMFAKCPTNQIGACAQAGMA